MTLRDPLLVASLAFSAGVAGATLFFPGFGFAGVLVALAGAVAFGTVFGPRFGFLIGMVLVAACLGAVRLGEVRSDWDRLPVGEFRGEARIVADAVSFGAMQRVMVVPVDCETEAFCPSEAITVFTGRGEEYPSGKQVHLECALTEVPDRPETAHDERGIARAHHRPYLCERPTTLFVSGDDQTALGALGRVRHTAGDVLGGGLPAAEGALASGLLLGGDDRISQDEQERYRAAGLSHIVAVSGFNMSIVGLYLFLVAIIIGCPRAGATAVVLIGLFVFTVFVGAPASAVRAAVMGGIGFVALSGGRAVSGYRLLAIAVAGMLLHNPLLLAYDLGFQLSVLATAGILMVGTIEAVFDRPFFGRAFLSVVVFPTAGALLFVVPWSAYVFGTFQPYALFANVLALPVIPAAFFLSVFALAGNALLPSLAMLLSYPAYLLLSFVRKVAEFTAILPFSSVAVSVPVLPIVFWYAALGGGLAFLIRRRRKQLLSYVTHP